MSASASDLVSVSSRSAADTESVGAMLARLLEPDTVVGLAGPLGAGKTCFARGVAAGLGVDPALVASPTFVYLVDYPGERLTLYHADLYRLLEVPAANVAEVYESIGLFAAFSGGGVTVVEWWDGYRGPPPASLVRVEFVMENAEHRRIEVGFAPGADARAAAFVSGLARAGLAARRSAAKTDGT